MGYFDGLQLLHSSRRRDAADGERGSRRGVQARPAASPAASPYKPVIPTIVLALVRSLENKMDHIRLLKSTQRAVRVCCVLVFTLVFTKAQRQHPGLRVERVRVEDCKTHGDWFCVYISDAWCCDATVVCRHCSLL